MTALTIPDAAARLRISPRSVYRLIAQRQIATTAAGTGKKPRLRITEEALNAFLKRNESQAKSA